MEENAVCLVLVLMAIVMVMNRSCLHDEEGIPLPLFSVRKEYVLALLGIYILPARICG
jgi:hypothetical protein